MILIGGPFAIPLLGFVAFAVAWSRGRLRIDNVCDLSRGAKPVEFHLTVIFLMLFCALLALACGWYFVSWFTDMMASSEATRT